MPRALFHLAPRARISLLNQTYIHQNLAPVLSYNLACCRVMRDASNGRLLVYRDEKLYKHKGSMCKDWGAS